MIQIILCLAAGFGRKIWGNPKPSCCISIQVPALYAKLRTAPWHLNGSGMCSERKIDSMFSADSKLRGLSLVTSDVILELVLNSLGTGARN